MVVMGSTRGLLVLLKIPHLHILFRQLRRRLLKRDHNYTDVKCYKQFCIVSKQEYLLPSEGTGEGLFYVEHPALPPTLPTPFCQHRLYGVALIWVTFFLTLRLERFLQDKKKKKKKRRRFHIHYFLYQNPYIINCLN